MSLKIISVVGARPNFMKVAPLHREFLRRGNAIESIIVHTGQHSDPSMSEVFLSQLNLEKPHYALGIGTGSHTELTAKIMTAFEEVLLLEKPDLVIVVGDVNSTFACALVTKRHQIPLAHVEAGLRSFDQTMPEEINRILTDQISDLLFVTEPSAIQNLKNENIPSEKIIFAGNCMIDSLVWFLNSSTPVNPLITWNLEPHQYIMMTMHRPSNVDHYEGLLNIINLIKTTADFKYKIIFPLHPRTKKSLEKWNLLQEIQQIPQLILTEPLGYFEFIQLMKNCLVILTDSGGIQEESSYLQIPCITFRKTTERPITVDVGSNILIHDFNSNQIVEELNRVMNGKAKNSSIPELWDGKTAVRITDYILSRF